MDDLVLYNTAAWLNSQDDLGKAKRGKEPEVIVFGKVNMSYVFQLLHRVFVLVSTMYEFFGEDLNPIIKFLKN